MIADRNIVCIASNWFDHPTSKQHVMRHLSQRNHVTWVNFHASRRPTFTRSDARAILRRLRQASRPTQHVAPAIETISPLLIPLPGSSLARRVNRALLTRHIRRALSRLPDRPTQLWLFTPDIPELIHSRAWERVIYYCVDDFAAFAGYNPTLVEQLERQTLAAADIVLATSDELHETRRRQHPNCHFIPHGVDFDHFAAAPHLPASTIPADLRDIPAPRLGYMGLISDYVDLDLLADVAHRRSDWSFVLLGDARCDTRAVSRYANIHLLGPRPYADLPAYCRGFDIGLIPFRMNRLVRAVNPIKLREYLAAGLPVVSSPMEAVLPYAPAVQTATTPDTFIAVAEEALTLKSHHPPTVFQDLVRNESWQARVAQLSDLVMNASQPARPAPPPPCYLVTLPGRQA